jgi:predicted RecB family nuclease
VRAGPGVKGASKLGDFHYAPLLLHEGGRVRNEQKRLLEVYGLLLSQIQGKQPQKGFVWHGPACKSSSVRLNLDLRTTERFVRGLKELTTSPESSPPLLLNDHCRVCEFRKRCHDQAVHEDHLSLIRGLREKEIQKYAKKGIFTVTQLAHTFRPRRRGKRSPPKTNHRYPALQALSIRDKRVYLFGKPQLPAAPVHVYLDIEGKPDEGFDYLIGLIVVEAGEERRYSFWANDRDQEQHVFEQFLKVLAPLQHFIVFSYGSYEGTFLKRMRRRPEHTAYVDRVLTSLVNVLSTIYSHVYFPTFSNGLKDVATCLGFTWTAPDASGIQSLVWRSQWEQTHNEKWKNALLTYNLEDCEALKLVTEFIYNQYSNPDPSPSPGQRTGTEVGPIVASVDEIDRLGTVKQRGKKEFFTTDFARINGCARFDYQRQRVYVRLGKRRRKAKGNQPRKYRNKKLRVNQRVEITSRKCPECGSANVDRPSTAHFGKGCFTKGKRVFDLVFTPSGIKRKVIECKAAVHECTDCGQVFVPERYQRLAKHYHGLMSWAMYQHISLRLSSSLVSDMTKELFGVTVYAAEISRFKPMMARYYDSCYRRVLQNILSSNVVQIDETEVKLRNGKGYVWVFTTLDEVVYMYRATREGSFLHDLLKDFEGVLVSDFFAAYDSLACPQQKCLLHLMRDMNQELLGNPYDEELQAITCPFGALLRSIVDTIDEHGLKRRYLERHAGRVAAFFASVEKQSFRSAAAESLRARLLKNRETLFTFIHHDGVPWNNNNPENAIRQFAYYRDGNPGRLKEAGLSQYLVLLSVCQTCRLKDVSFLRFMLSRERDIDAFRRVPRRKRRLPTVEIYPKGIVRPDFGGVKGRPVSKAFLSKKKKDRAEQET